MENIEFLSLLLLFLILGILGVYTSRIKGAVGELKVALWLKLLNRSDFKVIHNLLLETGNRSSQIDHLVISVYGIFVIETKNYKGWIHGHEHSQYWVQTIYKHKNRFRNPVIQNQGHIRTLRSILQGFEQVTYSPIVVFSGQAKLKNVYSDAPVIYARQLIKTIKRRKIEKVLTIEEVDKIVQELKMASVGGGRARRKHIRKAKKNARRQRMQEKRLICPKCGGDLIPRNGKHGKFHGCSNFPRCRYSKKT